MRGTRQRSGQQSAPGAQLSAAPRIFGSGRWLLALLFAGIFLIVLTIVFFFLVIPGLGPQSGAAVVAEPTETARMHLGAARARIRLDFLRAELAAFGDNNVRFGRFDNIRDELLGAAKVRPEDHDLGAELDEIEALLRSDAAEAITRMEELSRLLAGPWLTRTEGAAMRHELQTVQQGDR